MNRHCHAISRRAGGLFDLGAVTGEDYLYFFEKARPAWAEPCDIIFDREEMQKVWSGETDLFAILEGPLPADDTAVKNAIVSRIFAGRHPLIPQAIVRIEPLFRRPDAQEDTNETTTP